jgi:uncharacterized protein
MPDALIDTGVILAAVDLDDDWHAACVGALRSAPKPIISTEAVLTEAFHLIGSSSFNSRRLWDFVGSGIVTVQDITDSDLPELRSLMAKYEDRPMDFADATLVHIANRESISTVLTIDHDDFETYRLRGNKKFTILPGRTARKR